MRVIVLVSGGMDSVAALYHAHQMHDVVAGISFDYGSRHNPKEIPFAKHHCKILGVPHIVIDLKFVGSSFKSSLLQGQGDVPEGHYEEENMKQTVVPFRNGIMLSIAGGLAESKDAEGVVIAAHAGDHAIYPDCRESFMQFMGQAIKLGTYAEIELLRPFIDDTKATIVGRGHSFGVDLAQTWSCYKGLDIHCGQCGTCVERREAFELANIHDPTEYMDLSPLPQKPTPT
ncbi:7-cyano-7-deazaguanine synthase QueC [Verrucomicrobia bacterium]|nr:7-cyano-7-deazaguanine synthase QueC [Verrucomicrobiota bacterium]